MVVRRENWINRKCSKPFPIVSEYVAFACLKVGWMKTGKTLQKAPCIAHRIVLTYNRPTDRISNTLYFFWCQVSLNHVRLTISCIRKHRLLYNKFAEIGGECFADIECSIIPSPIIVQIVCHLEDVIVIYLEALVLKCTNVQTIRVQIRPRMPQITSCSPFHFSIMNL